MYTFTRLGTNADSDRTRGTRQKIYAVLFLFCSIAKVNVTLSRCKSSKVFALYDFAHCTKLLEQQTLKEACLLACLLAANNKSDSYSLAFRQRTDF